MTGIGTDVGKSWATGWLARTLNEYGLKTITQKFIQTGCTGSSEDIELHRRIMGTGNLPRDIDRTTAPVIFTYPASPDLAARIDKREIDFQAIENAAEKLLEEYGCVLTEGAGGVCVPLKEDYLTIDYIRDRKLPAILVTNGALGSISHTLLALNALKTEGIRVLMVIYNPHFDADEIICSDTRDYLRKWLGKHLPQTIYVEMPGQIV